MDFSYLSTTQIVTLVLAVVFSVLAVATTFFAFKNAEKIKSKALIFVMTLVMPFIAITCWLILIFSFVKGFKGNDILNIFVSIAISLFTCFMILIVANALYQKHKKDLEGVSEMEKEAAKLEKEATPAPAEETSSEWTLHEVVENSETEETPVEEIEEPAVETEEEVVETTEEVVEEKVEEPKEEKTEITEDDETIEPEKPTNFWLADDDE